MGVVGVAVGVQSGAGFCSSVGTGYVLFSALFALLFAPCLA